MKKAAFTTLGCKVNAYETSSMREMFETHGYETVPFDSIADVYLINTCSVTSISDRKSRQMIHRAHKLNPDGIILVTGCYSQVAPEIVLATNGVNAVIGTSGRKDIVNICESLTSSSKLNCVTDISHNHEFERLSVSDYNNRSRAYIKIQDGCNQFCSYCIIPYARGRERSRSADDIISEINVLAENGFTEVVLSGIHVASYGNDLENASLASLISMIDKFDGIRRIRLSSIEPMTISENFINDISQCEKLCHHFHLSLQSGCDATLRRMNRHYTTESFEGIVNNIRNVFPDAYISTDIMVGFPGETDAEFEETCRFIEKIGFSDMHVFKYSLRPGTRAASFPNRIDPKIQEARSEIIITAAKKYHDKFLSRFIGSTAEILFEQYNNGFCEGKSANYLNVYAESEVDLTDKYRTVRFDNIKNGSIYGTII